MIVFFTHDLLPNRERLMPWRTIIEVCKVFQNTNNCKVAIYSLDATPKNNVRTFQGINIYSVSKDCYQFKGFFERNNFSAIYFPITWRTSYKSIKPFCLFTGNKIAYFPGGVYNKSQTISALNYLSFKIAMPYLAEAFIPKKRVIKFLNKADFNSVISLTELTRDKIIEAGFANKDVIFIPPGKDILPNFKETLLIPIEGKVFEKGKYFLFMGGPAKIRGLELLLKSFDKACKSNKDLELLCFLRTDPGSNNSYIIEVLEKSTYRTNITIVWHEVTKELLFNFVSNAKAVILPFLLVPSEIPLTYLEVLCLGTTIISTRNGGTTDYLSDSIFISENNEKSMEEKIRTVWVDDTSVNRKKENAKLKMSKHPNWTKVGERWFNLIINSNRIEE